ncbi:cupin domain-containing protein [Geomicrobium sp. JCM 19038]|uniref:cupin domain-containing protein n=1 Tax=Geomicrobium sp. JCM 19038 TaxID=1460635 RepID=UPI00045F14AA|nr:cupin domain-containing protein [Geomicrobium sp. JCM 19038]GAK08261.1 hypothetical protein JCM19038_2038 [Geomicrobium sp. JCM 19038]
MKQASVNTYESLEWNKFTEHIDVYNQEIFSAEEANNIQVNVSSILREHLKPGGQVVPHYHSVAEVIHITTGEVELLKNGEWVPYKAGDTFIIPKEVVHSVRNVGNKPSEQISVFLPVEDNTTDNSFFDTVLVESETSV